MHHFRGKKEEQGGDAREDESNIDWTNYGQDPFSSLYSPMMRVGRLHFGEIHDKVPELLYVGDCIRCTCPI